MKSNYILGSNDNDTFPVNTEFPFRKYALESKVKYILEKILNSSPNIVTKTWKIPNNKIKFKGDKDLFYLTHTVVCPTLELIDDHWSYDQIIDYYNEEARIKTPGYGEKYSPWEYWHNEKLHRRWKKGDMDISNTSKHVLRERLYSNLTEARPAYSTVGISLYKALSNLISYTKQFYILDIAAYGERAIASAALNYNYDGIDPNYDLINGHDKLLMDLRCLNPNCNIQFYHISLEDYKSCKLYDIITYSIPPFNTEPYAKDSEYNKNQSYIKHPTFDEYLCCFLMGIIYKAYKLCKIDGVFSITALDRMPKYHPPRVPNEYISKNIELIYVEVMLLMISSMGFKYNGAIGLAVGNKDPSVPWWTFIKQDNSMSYKCITLMKEYYLSIYNKVGARCLSLLDKEDLFTSITKEVTIESSVLKISNTEFMHSPSIKLELIRYQIQNYVVSMIHTITNISEHKIKTILGRYLMLRSISATYDEPWKSCLFVDPVFPTISKHIIEEIEEIEDYFVSAFNTEFQSGTDIVKNYEYWFKSYTCIGISQLYHTIAHYIPTIPLSTISIEIDNDYKIRSKGLQNIPGYSSDMFDFNIQESEKNIDVLAVIRYKTLGAIGHQYTRPIERTKVIEQIVNQKIIDIYASIFNTNSLYYCSLYPDVEKNSYGSAFSLHMIEGAYLANPVDIPIFLKKSISNILQDLNTAFNNNKKLLISTSFTLWLDNNSSFMENFNNKDYKKLLANTDNIGLEMLSNSSYIRSIYILNKKLYPSTYLQETSSVQRNTISVGILLSSLPNLLITKYISNLAEPKYYRIIG